MLIDTQVVSVVQGDSEAEDHKIINEILQNEYKEGWFLKQVFTAPHSSLRIPLTEGGGIRHINTLFFILERQTEER